MGHSGFWQGQTDKTASLIYEAKRDQFARLVSLILRISTKRCRATTHLPHQTSGVKWRGKGEVAREEQAGFLRSHFQKMAYEITAFPYGKRWDWTLLHTAHKNRSETVCIPKSTNKSQNQKTFRRNQKRVYLLSSNGQRFPRGM